MSTTSLLTIETQRICRIVFAIPHGKIFPSCFYELTHGKTQREAAEQLGVRDKYVVKEFVNCHNRQQTMAAAGVISRAKDRPRKDAALTDAKQMKDYEIKQLRMVNELLRDFLRAAGRK